MLWVYNHYKHSPTSSHLYSLQVENCGSNLRLVLDEDDDSKFRIERVNYLLVRGLILDVRMMSKVGPRTLLICFVFSNSKPYPRCQFSVISQIFFQLPDLRLLIWDIIFFFTFKK